MKPHGRISDTKVEITQRVMAITDQAMLSNFLDILISWERAGDAVPKDHLDAIARGIADSKAGRITPLEDYLKELDGL
jgi:hypothetical protein